jgi:adenosyl cobinamide kinase/adenosyl cobinamide phosphate guanylyltransferase
MQTGDFTMADSWLVTGGSRSGKSHYALTLASASPKPFFIATGWAGDQEMERRIAKHRAERGPQWETIETRLEIVQALQDGQARGASFLLVDCLTLWTSNILIEEPDSLERRVAGLEQAIPQISVPLCFVTNEVGSGIVPGDPLSRAFRDAAGMVNRRVAAAVASVVLTVCGIPMKVK